MQDLLNKFPQKGSDLIKYILNDFAEKGVLFCNEHQLQFELGVRLKEIFDKYKKNYSIKFESVFLFNENNSPININNGLNLNENRKKRKFIDILIETENGENNFGIELKYKISNYPSGVFSFDYHIGNGGKKIVFPQGAYVNGCYGFLGDVSRLETLKRNKLINAGVAIIITNDKNYYCEHRAGSDAYTFSLYDGRKFSQNTVLSGQGNDRSNSISLTQNYTLKWNDYNLDIGKVQGVIIDGNGQPMTKELDKNIYKFKYLVLDI